MPDRVSAVKKAKKIIILLGLHRSFNTFHKCFSYDIKGINEYFS